MEIMVLLGYTAILALVAPFVLPKSDFYGKLVPAGIAAAAGGALWLILTWLGFAYDQAWIWLIVMLAMPIAVLLGIRGLGKKRAGSEAKQLAELRAAR